jgi:hypothetical protein
MSLLAVTLKPARIIKVVLRNTYGVIVVQGTGTRQDAFHQQI